MAKPSSPKRRRLTRQDWIDAAIDRLIKNGVDAVRVEPLADIIGVSRGSFYWHFNSRRELLEAILDTWREHQTRRIVERIRQDRKLAPIQRLARLRMLPPRTRTSAEAAAFELAIRAWAMRDKLVRKIVDQVDAERVKFTGSLLIDASMAKSEAQYWALIGYAYTLGESMLRANMTDHQILECRSRLLATQTQHLVKNAKDALRETRRQLADAAIKAK
jgi:AcrR family transcriptional regulator